MNRIDFVSTGRADFSNHAAVLAALDRERVAPRVVLAGDPALTRDAASALVGAENVVVLDDRSGPNDPAALGAAAGRLVTRYAALLDARIDAVVLVGDRWELFPVLTAAVLRRTPVVHLSGGEITRGALDEQVRHAVTHSAHLHCVAHESFAARLRRMGEEPWRVHVTGDPGIDGVLHGPRADAAELRATLGVPIDAQTLIVALHPVTNEPAQAPALWSMLVGVLEDHAGAVVVTGPNRDPGSDELRAMMVQACAARAHWRFVEHLGSARFAGLVAAAGALVGNSSAGVWESPALGALSINLGTRQAGRLRSAYTLDVDEGDATGLRCALAQCLSGTYRARVAGSPSPYGDGQAAPRVAALLAALPSRDRLLDKRFHDETVDAR